MKIAKMGAGGVHKCKLAALVCYLFDNLERSWQFPGRGGKAAVCAVCPQQSGKVHCSLGEVLSPAVSSAVLASCMCVQTYDLQNGYFETI